MVGRLVESPKELGVAEGEVCLCRLSWNREVAKRGDTLDLTAEVAGAADGTEVKIEIWEYDDGSHDLIMYSTMRDS